MSGRTNKISDELTAPVRFDRVAIAATAGLVLLFGLLAAFVVYGRIAEAPWLQWLLERRWLAALAVALIAFIALLAVDLTRRKNIAWRLVERQYGQRSASAAHGNSYAAGRGRFGPHSYWGLRCYGSASGLAIVRVSAVHRALFIPWSAISVVETLPSVLTGRRGFETDIAAGITLRDRPALTIEVPWLAEFRGHLPKTAKLRSTKLPGQGQAQQHSQRQPQGDFKGLMKGFRKTLGIKDDVPENNFQLAMRHAQAGNHEAAVKILRKIAATHPDHPGLHYQLGVALMKLGKTEEAITNFREAISRQPDVALAHNGLGFALMTRNDIDGAVASFRRALAVKPDFARVHSNLLMALNYQAGWTQKRLHQEALQFDLRQARKLLRGPPVFGNSRDKQKILKIGYVSPDFREHSVAHFTRKLLGAHDREKIEVYGYAEVAKPDAFTSQFEAQADHWLSVVEMEDEEVAERIRQDGIDILVDLAGHTSDNRLLVFARRPAPIQVTWLGYPNTTGMRTMDYRLTDSVADPPGEGDNLYSEKLVRLEHGFLCYQTAEPDPAVSPPPCLIQGHITIGTFNTTRKITSEVIQVWAQILKSLPGAHLLLKSESLDDEPTKAKLLKMLGQQGISPERVELLGSAPGRKEQMGLYSRVDIGVDPFPYNGTTTTCEALWMGVPVVCLRGDRHASRVGASILQHAGLPELVADSKDEYVELVRSLAGDKERLTTLRNALRPQMRESTLMDLRLFTDTLENAYREMWITWCDRQP